ncbi:uncharacterized protein V6R79_006248 [Siganus canaliculatus]
MWAVVMLGQPDQKLTPDDDYGVIEVTLDGIRRKELLKPTFTTSYAEISKNEEDTRPQRLSIHFMPFGVSFDTRLLLEMRV